MKPLFKTLPKSKCKCALCRQGDEFYKIISKLPKKEKEFMIFVYDELVNTREELGMTEAYIEDLSKKGLI